MTMIQIEQDSADTIEQARKAIADMATKMREAPNDVNRQQGCVMHCIGYQSALVLHGLVSSEVYSQLMNELWQVRDAALD